jgi:cell division protein FtsA
VEIIEQVYAEIKIYGHEDPKKKLIAGIVLTGGGAELKHIKQLVEYITGMDTRIGYPNEHLAGNSDEELSSPLYATAVGLVMNSVRNNTKSATPLVEMKKEEPVAVVEPVTDEPTPISEKEVEKTEESTGDKIKKSFFDKYIEKIKEFLDNAE